MSTRLLLADDSHTIQKVVGMIFPPPAHELTTVSNASEVVATARRTSPDIILLDTRLGEANGLDICRELRSTPETASTPIILLCGAFEQLGEEEERGAGADDVVIKPFEAQLLIDRVTALLSRPRVVTPAVPTPEPPAATPPAGDDISPLDFSFAPAGEIQPSSLDIFATTSESLFTPEPPESVHPSPSPFDLAMESPFEATSLVEPPPVSSPAVPPADSTDFLAQAFEEPASPIPTDSIWGSGSAPVDIFSSTVEPSPEPPPPSRQEVLGPVMEEGSAPAPSPVQPVAPPPSGDVDLPLSSPPPVVEEPASAPPEFSLSEAQIEQIVSRISREIIERVAWEVVPDLAEILIKEEIRKIKEG